MDKGYTENGGTYKQLSAEARGKIETYRSLTCLISKVVVLTNRSKSTVCEEIKRGKRFYRKPQQNSATKFSKRHELRLDFRKGNPQSSDGD